MKSSIIAAIPFVGLAIAQDSCTPRYVTVTNTRTQTVTVQPSKNPVSATEAGEPITIESTIFVTPSPVPFPTAPLYPNGTFNSTARAPTTLATISFVLPSSESETNPSATAAPAQSSASNVPAYPIESSVIPTSEAPSTPEPSASAPATPEPETSPAEDDVPADSTDAATTTGSASHYGGNLSGGMCSFTGYTLPSGLFGTAYSGAAWDTASACGTCVAVTGPNGATITAMVVDQCPECDANKLDLFENAFSELAPLGDGIIDVSFETVPCGIDSPIELKNKEGTSANWFSMQVRNANVGVESLEVSTDGGSSWMETERKEYNFFENASGFGADVVDVRVTSVGGESVVVEGVSCAPQSAKKAGRNFG